MSLPSSSDAYTISLMIIAIAFGGVKMLPSIRHSSRAHELFRDADFALDETRCSMDCPCLSARTKSRVKERQTAGARPINRHDLYPKKEGATENVGREGGR